MRKIIGCENDLHMVARQHRSVIAKPMQAFVSWVWAVAISFANIFVKNTAALSSLKPFQNKTLYLYI